MFQDKEALLLDMNSTFMFGEDRFGEGQDYSKYYRSIGGSMSDSVVNNVIGRAYEYLDEKYHLEEYRYCFPSLETAIEASAEVEISLIEKRKSFKLFRKMK